MALSRRRKINLEQTKMPKPVGLVGLGGSWMVEICGASQICLPVASRAPVKGYLLVSAKHGRYVLTDLLGDTARSVNVGYD